MGKVNANLADVQTEFVPPASGEYEMKIVEIDESKKDADGLVVVKSAIDEVGNEEYGKPIYDRIYLRKKDGGDNGFGWATVKKYFIAVCGEDRANAGDLDYDELKNGRFRGIVEQYTYEDKKTKKERTGAQLAEILPL